MSGLPWFKCDPKAFREGMLGLTPDERGAYVTVLMLIYERGAAYPDEPYAICAHLGVSVRMWNKLRDTLIAKGKLFRVDINTIPCLSNKRAETEISAQRELREKLAQGGRRPREKTTNTNENSCLEPAKQDDGLKPAGAGQPKREDRELEKESPPDPPHGGQSTFDLEGGQAADPIKDAFDAYNALADELNLPKAVDLTETRRKKLKARIARGRWPVALEAVRNSAFLRGERKPDFRASLDFLLQESSFQKVIEGFYGNDGPPRPGGDQYEAFPG